MNRRQASFSLLRRCRNQIRELLMKSGTGKCPRGVVFLQEGFPFLDLKLENCLDYSGKSINESVWEKHHAITHWWVEGLDVRGFWGSQTKFN